MSTSLLCGQLTPLLVCLYLQPFPVNKSLLFLLHSCIITPPPPDRHAALYVTLFRPDVAVTSRHTGALWADTAKREEGRICQGDEQQKWSE